MLLIDGIAVRLNERARSGSQLLFLTPSYLLHSSRDDVGYIPHPTFFDLQCQNSHGAIVEPWRKEVSPGASIRCEGGRLSQVG